MAGGPPLFNLGTKIGTPEGITQKQEATQMSEATFYKKNVPYRVGVRMHLRDAEGVLLSDDFPYVEVPKDRLREFLQANKDSISKGKILQIDEPPLEEISPNALTDEQAIALVKSFFDLRKKLPEITSEEAVLKLIAAAKSEKRSDKTVQLIMDRYEELSPTAMQGVE